jgi:hypothetical protein
MVAQPEAGRDNPNLRIRLESELARKIFVLEKVTKAHILPARIHCKLFR